MSELTKTITLTPAEEATRLWSGAVEAFEKAPSKLVYLAEALDLGVRAVEIVALRRLQAVAPRFPATIAHQLEAPDPEVNTERDAVVLPHTLQFVDVIDLLSEEEESCVSPRLHRGWEDRRYSCRRSRALAREATGTTISPHVREKMLRLAAYRNRIFRLPPPVKVVTAEILDAFPELVDLYEKLES